MVDQAWDRFLAALEPLNQAGKLGAILLQFPQWFPIGYPSSIPPMVAATSDLAVVRMHGHSDKWTSKDIHERFLYRYNEDELKD